MAAQSNLICKEKNDLRVLVLTGAWTPESPTCPPYILAQVESLRREHLHVEIFCYWAKKNPINYVRAWLSVGKLLRKNKFDLIHAHHGQSGILCLGKRLPFVVTYHGSDLLGIPGANGKYRQISSFILRGISRYVSRRASEVIVVSEKLSEHLPQGAYHIIPTAVDLNRFTVISQTAARQKLSLSMDKKLILFASSVSNPVKRFALAQEAVALLAPETNAEIVVADNIAHDVMPLYMNACDVLLLTSLHEGSPTVVKEALACDLPIVSVDVGDVKQRIAGVEGCVVCSDSEPSTIALALAHVLQREQRIEGRAALKTLDENLLTQQLITIYKKAVESRIS